MHTPMVVDRPCLFKWIAHLGLMVFNRSTMWICVRHGFVDAPCQLCGFIHHGFVDIPCQLCGYIHGFVDILCGTGDYTTFQVPRFIVYVQHVF